MSIFDFLHFFELLLITISILKILCYFHSTKENVITRKSNATNVHKITKGLIKNNTKQFVPIEMSNV